MPAKDNTKGTEVAPGQFDPSEVGLSGGHPGVCRLCGIHAPLQNSHIIPSFVTKWLKETSATGFIRFGQNPNQRRQDGYKAYWLCVACERRLNEWETQFATNIFHPLMQDGGRRINYGDWFIRFCVSVSWRALLMLMDNGALDDFGAAELSDVDRARNGWAEFMLGKRSNISGFSQHFVPLDSISSATFEGLPSNMNRYIHRTIGADLVRDKSTIFVFTKMGKMIVLGFARLRRPQQLQGTRVLAQSGVVGQGTYVLPHAFGSYLASKAEDFAAVNRNYSSTQRTKIDASMWGNINRVAHSASFQAMRDDVRLFGQSAFRVHRPPKEHDVSGATPSRGKGRSKSGGEPETP